MELLVKVLNEKEFKEALSLDRISGIIIPLKDYTFYDLTTFDVKKVKEVLDEENVKDLYLSLERVFKDEELKELEAILETLPLEKFKGIFYTDLGLAAILSKKGYKDLLIYRAPTYVTNHLDLNFYSLLGASSVLSNQISVDEALDVDKNARQDYFIDLFGKEIIFTSRRMLISGYRDYFKVEDVPSILKEGKREEKLNIIEASFGTIVFQDGFYYLPKINCFEKAKTAIIHLDFFEGNMTKLVEALANYLDSGDEDSLKDPFDEMSIKINESGYGRKTYLSKEETR